MHTKFERLLSKSLTALEVMTHYLVVHTGPSQHVVLAVYGCWSETVFLRGDVAVYGCWSETVFLRGDVAVYGCWSETVFLRGDFVVSSRTGHFTWFSSGYPARRLAL